jgi:predicted DsbA family dithiol-disulfide isomerase
MPPVKISYYSDLLCVWAYISQRRLDQLVADFGDRIEIEPHFCSVFPDAWGKIEGAKGFEGFNAHLCEVAAQFPHVELNPKIWLEARPRSSSGAHLFVKAIELVEAEDADLPAWSERAATKAAWALRCGFFEHGRDISSFGVQCAIADELGLDRSRIEDRIRSSEAMTALLRDYQACSDQGIKGSPTFVMNEGRQRLFGNVGYKLIEANVLELLRHRPADQASWC